MIDCLPLVPNELWMTRTEHSVIELVSAVSYFVLAGIFIYRFRKFGNIFELAAGLGFIGAGLVDGIHGYLSYLNQDLIQHWVPWTWAVSRQIVVSSFAVGIYASHVKLNPEKVVLYSTIMIGAIAAIAIQPAFVSMESFVQAAPCDEVKRILDLILAIEFFVLFPLSGRLTNTDIGVPLMFRIILLLSVSLHVVMALDSAQALDPAFRLAHYLKAGELNLWIITMSVATAFLLIKRKNNELG